MAIHMMEISGKIANVVFYKMYGKNFVRSAPKKSKRTRSMKLRNKNFGIAARGAKLLRRMMMDIMPFPKNRSIQSRFSGAISRWIGKREVKDIIPETGIIYLLDFQFNDKTSIRGKWKTSPQVINPSANLLQVKIPAFIPTEAIIAPEHTVSVEMTIAAAMVMLVKVEPAMLVNENVVNIFSTSTIIPYDNVEIAAQLINLPVKMDRGSLIITSCAFKYSVKTLNGIEKLKDPLYLPASVIDARYY